MYTEVPVKTLFIGTAVEARGIRSLKDVPRTTHYMDAFIIVRACGAVKVGTFSLEAARFLHRVAHGHNWPCHFRWTKRPVGKSGRELYTIYLVRKSQQMALPGMHYMQ